MHVPSLTFESVHISGAVIWLSHQAFLRERRRTVRCRRASRAENALKVTPLVTRHSDHRAARDIVIGRAERMLSYRILLCRIVSYRIVSYRIVSCCIVSCCILCVLYMYCVCTVSCCMCTVQHPVVWRWRLNGGWADGIPRGGGASRGPAGGRCIEREARGRGCSAL